MATSRMSKSWADYTPGRETRDEETKGGKGNRAEIEVVEQFPEMTTANNPIKSKRLNSVPHKVSHKLKSCEEAIAEIRKDALVNVKSVAKDITSELVKVLGGKVDTKTLTSVVNAKMKG